jgi:acyl-CoA thioesterase-1
VRTLRNAYGAIAAAFNGSFVAACVAAPLLWFAVVFPAAAQAEPLRIAMLGDSLTAGYGLPPQEALPVKLQAALKAAGRDVVIANHGVSGDTSAGGLARLDWMMADKPKLVLVALGANDALRGTDPAETERNLDAIITKLKAEGAAVMLFGMLGPRNYGPEYAKAFDGLYPKLAEKHGIPLYPFLLEGVAMDRALNQPDGIHPNVKGVEALVSRIAPELIKAIDALK